MVLSASRCKKNLFRNTKDEIILEGSMVTIRRDMEKEGKTVCSTKEKYLATKQALARIYRCIFVKRVIVKAGIPSSISKETVRRVLQ